MLQKPFLALCTNRNTQPKTNLVTGSPENWFDNSVLLPKGLVGFSFDFFVNWSTNQITPFVWVKRIINIEPSKLFIDGEIDSDLISKEIIKIDGLENLEALTLFCRNKNLTLQYVLFREIDWGKNPESIFIVTLTSANNNLNFDIDVINLNELQARIRSYSGGAIRVGAKGLMYGTSMLECFLSKTDSLYPGDVDLIIFDLKTLEINTILEFKKHNLDTPIENEKLKNYYPNPDHRKYDRLAILRDYLTPVPKLICLYYPTKTNENGKAEIITGNVGELIASKSKTINLPRIENNTSYENFATEILAFN